MRNNTKTNANSNNHGTATGTPGPDGTTAPDLATLTIYSDDHDGAFTTPWTAIPEYLVLSVADWLRHCQRTGAAPTADSYFSFTQNQPDPGMHFGTACAVEGTAADTVALLFQVITESSGDGWTVDVTVWQHPTNQPKRTTWVPWIVTTATSADLSHIHQLAAYAVSNILRHVRGLGRPDLTADSVAEWETVRADHLAAARTAA